MTVKETALAPFGADGVWVKRIPLRFFGLHMGTRMTVIRLGNGGLFVHSPTPATPETRAAVDALGPVRFIVAPNRLHHLFVSEWTAAYPEALLYGVKELMGKRRDLPWRCVLGDAPEEGWAGDIGQCLFRGSRFQEEAVFCHRASGTLIVVDLLESVWPEDAWIYRLFARLAGTWQRPALTYDQRLLFRDRDAARASFARIMAWDFDRIILAHGRLIERDGKSVMREAFRWLTG